MASIASPPSPVTTGPGRGRIRGLIRAARPKQWGKNLLVVIAPAAAGVLDQSAAVLDTVLAFTAFCLAAGGTYLINDAADVEADRAHPRKCRRPVAAGVISPRLAVVAGVGAVVAGLVVASLTGHVLLPLTIACYLALTTVYSLWMKHVVILDMVGIAGGFVLRAVAGATAVGVGMSHWFLIVVSLGSLFVVAGKRSAELSGTGVATRAALAGYTSSFLGYVRAMSSGALLVSYALWALDAYSGPTALAFGLSIVPFTIGVLRYAMLVDGGGGESPEDLLFSDRLMLACGTAVGVALVVGVYLV